MEIKKKIIALIFVVIFANYYVSTTFFSHSHVINGATISHSHFHTDAHHATKNGGHEQSIITLIAQISHFENTVLSCLTLPVPAQCQLPPHKHIETTHWITSIYFNTLSLRAPPIM